MSYRLPLIRATIDWGVAAGIPLALYADQLYGMIFAPILAFDFSNASTGIGVLTVAIVLALGKLTPAIAEFLKTCGPPFVELVGKLRTQWHETTELVHANAAAIATEKARADKQDEIIALLTAQNEMLRVEAGRSRSEINNLKQENSAIGEANLIDHGFIRDTGREKGGAA